MTAHTTQALIVRSIEAAKTAGLTVYAVEARAGGHVIVRTSPLEAENANAEQEGNNSCDTLFGEKASSSNI